MPKASYKTNSLRGLTLTELLVVLTILGMLATGIVPATQVILNKSESNNVEMTIKESWRLALAHAQANQSPILWNVKADDHVARISVLDSREQSLWTTTLQVAGLRMRTTTGSTTTGEIKLLVYPHGLASPVQFEWQSAGRMQVVTLPPDLPDSVFSTAQQHE